MGLPDSSPPLLSSLQPLQPPFHPLVPSSATAPLDSPSARSNYDLPSQYYRNAVDDVHSVLYGGTRKGDRHEIKRVVANLYSGGAGQFDRLTGGRKRRYRASKGRRRRVGVDERRENRVLGRTH